MAGDNDEEITPAEGVVDNNSGTETADATNWQEQYQQLQPEYTRATQEAASLRSTIDSIKTDPEAQREFLRELGYELDEPDDEDDELEPDELAAVRREIAQLQEQVSQQSNQRQQAELETHFDQAFARFGEERGKKLTDREKNAVFSVAMSMAMAKGDNGPPPVEEAWREIEALWEDRQKEWAGSKQPSYRVSPNGKDAEQKPDLSTDEGKTAHILRRMAESQP